MELKQGTQYEATLMLTGFKQIASNDAVGKELEKVGFTNVVITGAGKQRRAIGRWGQPNLKDAPVPKEVTEIKEV